MNRDGRYKLYTPDGVQDFMLEQCFLKKNMEQRIRKHLRSAAYHEIETPSIEYFDVFTAGAAVIEQEMMYKFVDKEGRLLVLRPDLTIPAARFFSTKLKGSVLPMKFFYIGNVFRYNEFGGGRSKEFTQAGIEIIGAPSAEADAEAVAEAILLTKAAGLRDFQIDLGQADFFKGLIEEAGFREEEGEEVRLLVDKKDYAQLEYLLKEKRLSPQLRSLLLEMPFLFGDTEILDRAASMTKNRRSLEAIENLRRILCILEDYGLREYVSIDLGLVNSLNYYTGTIFKGFAHGIGFPVLSGGRYDTLLETYGAPAAATGFSLGINIILQALSRQGAEEPVLPCKAFVGFGSGCRKQALHVAESLRGKGISAYLDLSDFEEEAGLAYAKASESSVFVYLRRDGTIRYCDFRAGVDRVMEFESFKTWGFVL